MPLLVIEMTQMMYLRILMITPSIQTKDTESLAQKVVRLFFPWRAVSIHLFSLQKHTSILQKALKWAAFVFISWKFQKKETFSKLFIIIMLAWFCKWTLIDNTFLPCDHPFNLRKIWKILHNTRKRRFEKNTGWNN